MKKKKKRKKSARLQGVGGPTGRKQNKYIITEKWFGSACNFCSLAKGFDYLLQLSSVNITCQYYGYATSSRGVHYLFQYNFDSHSIITKVKFGTPI